MPSTKRPLNSTQRRELLERLSEPFEPEEIKWFVKATTPDAKRGLLLAEASQLA